jgi:hypothetical protein
VIPSRRTAIVRLALLAVVISLAAGAVPALSSPFSVTRHVGVSLRRVSMQPGMAVRHDAPRSAPLRVGDPAAYRRAKAEAEEGYRRWLREHPSAAEASGGAARQSSVSGSSNHAGLAAANDAQAMTPPDTTGAVGPSNYVEMVNRELAIYSKADLGAPTETMPEPNFVGAPDDLTCDGNVEWDQQGRRWLYSALGGCFDKPITNVVYFGWSRTSSPSLVAGNWCQYAIDTGSNLDDYPRLGHDNSQILIGVNQFGPGDVYPEVYVLDKPADGDTSCPSLATEQSTAAVLTLGRLSTGGAWTPVAVNLADSSADGYVVAVDFDHVHLHLYTVGRDSNQANVLLDSETISVPGYCVPPNVPQPGTPDTLESSDTRLTQAVAVTDPTTGREGIWTQHTVSASCTNGSPRGPSVVRWYELAPGAGAPTQIGTVRGANGAFTFMGAISPSFDGRNAAIFYNSSSSTALPDLRVRDRHLQTTSGSMGEELQLATSTYPDEDSSCDPGHGDPCRWGDYTGASPDPSDPSLVWGAGEVTVAPPDDASHAPQWGSENAAIDVTPAGTYGLNVDVTDTRSGTGSVSSSPAGIAACTSSCAHDYLYGTPVQLTATAGAHSVFSGWSGDCSGTGECSVPMGGPQNVTATFAPQSEKLSYRRSGAGSGTVTSSPAGLKCRSRCSAPFDYGTRVRLRATAARGSVFGGWSGPCHGYGACHVAMNAGKRVRATFAKKSSRRH